ncbi:DoxX family protein [Hymenobacter terricola]|uniref:DoxX family protein n=1 Tax=Hymenobacter terricola TaxID=2819236 RepID=UPI001B30846D|nr:DoxX family protein [Hymenobacter terricola]
METPRSRPVLFWLVTGLLAFGMLAGATAQLLRAQINVDGMRHLGYPLYVLTLVGVWKVAGVLVLLLPGWRLAKEWAYAGFFFLLTGAVVSHLASGEGPLAALAPFVFACLTVASWQLRPASRRLVLAPTLAAPTHTLGTVRSAADFAPVQTQPQPLN